MRNLSPRLCFRLRLGGVFAVCIGLLVGSLCHTTQVNQAQTLKSTDVIEGNPAATCQHNGHMPNRTYSYRLRVGAMTRHYLVHTPASKSYTEADLTAPQAVIVAFGGRGMSQSAFERISQLNYLPALIVYPQPLHGKYRQRAWQGAPYANQHTNDIAFVRRVLQDVAVHFCVNMKQVYSVGFSNGGGLTWILSCQVSEKFAAFAMIAGAYYYPEAQCKPTNARSILHIHGQRDTTVPYTGSKKRKLPAIDNWIARRAATNHCQVNKPITYHAHRGTIIQMWNNCSRNTVVMNVKLQQTGHIWPLFARYAASDTGEDEQLMTVTQFIWQFLSTSAKD